MAQIIVAFGSEREAQEAIGLLSRANIGEVRARVLNSSEPLSHPKSSTTSPVITPGLGSIEVRPSETPKTPATMHDDDDEHKSAAIPTAGGETEGVQVMIEVGDSQVDEVWRILGVNRKDSGEQPGE
jgi:hypothetical protein